METSSGDPKIFICISLCSVVEDIVEVGFVITAAVNIVNVPVKWW